MVSYGVKEFLRVLGCSSRSRDISRQNSSTQDPWYLVSTRIKEFTRINIYFSLKCTPRFYLLLFGFPVMVRKLTNLQNYNMYLYTPEYISIEWRVQWYITLNSIYLNEIKSHEFYVSQRNWSKFQILFKFNFTLSSSLQISWVRNMLNPNENSIDRSRIWLGLIIRTLVSIF